MTNGKRKQPKVFLLSVLTSMFERFGYYILTFSLAFYLESAFNLGDKQKDILIGIFLALTFLSPAIGGYLADNYFGIRRTMLIGLFMEATGLAVLTLSQFTFYLHGIPFFPDHFVTVTPFYWGLACIVIGVGLYKTAPTDLLARAYEENDPRIDSGFTLYYMLMNMGSIVCPIFAGYLQKRYGWNCAFLAGSAIIYTGILVYFFLVHRARDIDVPAGSETLPVWKGLLFLVGIVVATWFTTSLFHHEALTQKLLFLTVLCLLGYFCYEMFMSPRIEKLRIFACLLLIFIGMMFFIMYFQYYMSMELFLKRVVSHQIFGYKFPAMALLSLNSIWIVILSPLLVALYNKLSEKNKDLSITTKFPLGVGIISLCFFVLFAGTHFHNAQDHVNMLWFVVAAGLYSLGELLVSALGVAMVTRIAPERMYGVMMGAWYLMAASLASYIGGWVAGFANVPTSALTQPLQMLHIYGTAFMWIGVAGIGVTALTFLAAPYIRKIAAVD